MPPIMYLNPPPPPPIIALTIFAYGDAVCTHGRSLPPLAAPLLLFDQNASSRGIRVIIAGAGGAAHLPGMVAAMTPLPVIGVPVKTSTLSGVDSLHSIVQMPRGIPVATVGIGNSTNAGLLAVRMLGGGGGGTGELLTAMEGYMAKSGEEVEEKALRMEEQGWKEYLSNKADKSTTVGV